MKRKALEKHLRAHGCRLDHEGGKHTVWLNPANGKTTTVPRGSEVKKYTAKSIFKDLEVEPPPSTA